MKKRIAILMLLILTLSLFSCGGTGSTDETTEGMTEGTTEGGNGETTALDGTTASDGASGSETGDEPSPDPDGEMIYYENFDGYGDVTGNAAVFQALRENGVWRLDDHNTPYYPQSNSYTQSSTCLYALRDGKLLIMGQKNENGTAIKNPVDTYLVVQDENYLWELCGKDYTIQYTVSYESFADVRRYACVLWNYYGQYYNSFHLRVNGTGNLQGHMAGAWLDHDRYTPATDLYSGSSDGDGGTSIANKLLGLSLDGNTGDAIFRDIEVTVRIRISESGATSVWLSCGGDFVEVARYDASSEIGDGLNSHLSRCNGGALAIKTGAGINATLDELMVYMGHGDEPRDKTVTYTPGEPPEIKVEFDLTQESVLSSGKYSDSKYSSFNAISDAEWVVPALKQGMIPQGMDIWEEKNLLVISGYFRDYSLVPSSVLVTVDLITGKLVGEYLLKNADGTYHTSHVGGVAVSDRNLYIASGSYLYRIPISALNDAGNHGTLKIVESITVPVRASFCNVSDGMLWVGDFYIPNDATYQTPEWRHMTNRDGKTYGGLCVGYRLDDKTESGITVDAWREGMECSTPDVALSITQKIQGFTIAGDKIALSQSYGRTNNATILLYHNVLSEPEHSEIKINDTLVPVWFLDSKAEAGSYVTMPMTEGLATHNGDLLILYESGATYYKDNGGKNPTDRIWRMDLK